MTPYIFDIETDDLNATKIHVLSICYPKDGDWEIRSISDYEEMRKFFLQEDILLVGHNIVQFDLPAIQRILGVKPKNCLIADTMGISWMLYPNRSDYKLGTFGKEYGLNKIEITDWTNLTYEQYKERCEVDVRINVNLWVRIVEDLTTLYGSLENAYHFIEHVSFKLFCLHLQEVNKWPVDLDLIDKNIGTLQAMLEDKMRELRAVMPKVHEYAVLNPPEKMYKANGHISNKGLEYLNMLYGGEIPQDLLYSAGGVEKTGKRTNEPLKYIKSTKEPNPKSSEQVKNWLYSLGWKPMTWKFDKKANPPRKIPQVFLPDKSLCPSVLAMADKNPQIRIYEGVGQLSHRISLLQGFKKIVAHRANFEAKLIARASGFTNTMRLKHAEIVNLPKMKAAYGEYVRPVLTSEEGFELVEADLVSLENTTRNHYIWEYDKAYVLTMSDPDYDSHTELAVISGAMTKEEEKFFKWYNSRK